MHWIDWLIVLCPLLLVTRIGFKTQEYVKGASDFLSMGREAVWNWISSWPAKWGGTITSSRLLLCASQLVQFRLSGLRSAARVFI